MTNVPNKDSPQGSFRGYLSNGHLRKDLWLDSTNRGIYQDPFVEILLQKFHLVDYSTEHYSWCSVQHPPDNCLKPYDFGTSTKSKEGNFTNEEVWFPSFRDHVRSI